MTSLIITLDGPAGSGKSSVGRLLAQRLGLAFLDTGAMYRGLTAYCLDHGIDPASQPQQIADLACKIRIWFDCRTDPPQLHIDDVNMAARLRDEDTTASVSDIAAIRAVREVLVEAQRDMGRQHGRLVSEGRDQGSVVFPDAHVKFYLDAAPVVRARRRAEQLRRTGVCVDDDQIYRQLRVRDQRDVVRRDGPLVCPKDAVRIDTADMTLAHVVDCLEQHVKRRVAARVSP